MSAWDAYPASYRENEIRALLAAVQAGECAAVVGLSGAGKSNLIGFLHHRIGAQVISGCPAFILIDGNRIQPRTAEGLFRLIGQALSGAEMAPGEGMAGMETVLQHRLSQYSNGICLLFDRYDALSQEERAVASGPLRALRDTFKYQLTYLIAARHPPDPSDELAELFYANTLWLGPLNTEDAHWSADQYAKRRGQSWDDATLTSLVTISWGYPSLLRACCEAYAGSGAAALTVDALRAHSAIQRRVLEFWADNPTAEDLRRSRLTGHPLLSAAQPPVSSESPELTASEHRLLAWFQSHPGEVCAKDDLIHAVWPEDRIMDGLRDDSLAQLIRRLRQKVGADTIQTIPGRGYRYTRL
jgi:hypothetical protein